MNIYRLLIVLVTVLLPSMAFAHNLVNGQPVPLLSISDRGELSLVNDEVRYHRWDSSQLPGRVRIIQYIAGRTSAKDLNNALITAVKNAAFPGVNFRQRPSSILMMPFPEQVFLSAIKLRRTSGSIPGRSLLLTAMG